MPDKINELLFYECLEEWLKDNPKINPNDYTKTKILDIMMIYNKKIEGGGYEQEKCIRCYKRRFGAGNASMFECKGRYPE